MQDANAWLSALASQQSPAPRAPTPQPMAPTTPQVPSPFPSGVPFTGFKPYVAPRNPAGNPRLAMMFHMLAGQDLGHLAQPNTNSGASSANPMPWSRMINPNTRST